MTPMISQTASKTDAIFITYHPPGGCAAVLGDRTQLANYLDNRRLNALPSCHSRLSCAFQREARATGSAPMQSRHHSAERVPHDPGDLPVAEAPKSARYTAMWKSSGS